MKATKQPRLSTALCSPSCYEQKFCSNEQENEHFTPWKALPSSLLGLTFSCLTIMEALSCYLVCSRWRNVRGSWPNLDLPEPSVDPGSIMRLVYHSQVRNVSMAPDLLGAWLSHLPNMRSLNLNRFGSIYLNVENPSPFSTFAALRSLQIGRVKLTPHSGQLLNGLHSLHTLKLANCIQLTDAVLADWLRAVPSLCELELDECSDLSPSALTVLPPQIQNLTLINDDWVEDATLASLLGLRSLRDLRLQGCFTLFSLTQVRHLHSLRTLHIRECGVKDAALARISGLRSLRELDLSLCSLVTDAGLQHLSGLSELETLELEGLELVTDAGLAHLGGLVSLRRLNLGGLDLLTSACLAHLSKLTNLEDVELDDAD